MRNIDRMKKAIAENREARGQKKPCCLSGWPDIHARTCPNYKPKGKKK